MGGQGVRTVTVLVTDIVDSTSIRTRLGDSAADVLFATHDRVADHAIAAWGGELVKRMGDGVLAVFPGAADATEAAVAVQQGVAQLRESEPLELRVGLAAGDVAFEAGDIAGTPVVEAARLCSAATPAQILCSDLVRALAGSRISHELRPAGELALKGLPAPVSAHVVVWEPAIRSSLPLPPVLDLPAPFPFVGRTEEAEALLTAWKATEDGDRRFVLLSGEPGVGKTRLAAEIGRRAIEAGGLALAGRCDEALSVPYQPFVEAVAHYATHLPDAPLGHAPAELARLHPPLAAGMEEAPIPGLDPATERYRLFEAVASWLSTASADRPTLLVLDDLHWAATPTLLMLRHLARSAEPLRLLVVATYRDTDLSRSHPLSEMLADLRRDHRVQRLTLRGFDLEGVVTFLEAAAGHDLDEQGLQLARSVHDETEGNAFFVEEIIRHLVETGRLVLRDGRWTTDLDVDELRIPEGIRDVVGRRLSRLSETTNQVLARASVVGREWDVATVAAMGGGDEEVLATVEEAVPAGLLTEVGGPRATYAFSHALVRQTLYEELSVARRQRYHLAAADALDHVHGLPRVASVAGHLREAGAAADPERTVNTSLLAAEVARQQLAWEDATAHWSSAIELLEDQGGDPRQTARLLEQIGDAMYATAFDWEAGIAQLDRARAIYEDLGDRRSAAKVRSRIGRNLVTFPGRLQVRRGLEHLEAALSVLEPEGASAALAYAHIAVATSATASLDLDRGAASAERALEIGLELGSEKVQANALALLGPMRVYRGRIDEGLAAMERAREMALRLDEPLLAWISGFTLATFGNVVVDPRHVETVAREELESGRYDGAPALKGTLVSEVGGSMMTQGRLEEARHLLDAFSADVPPTVEYLCGDFAKSEREAARHVDEMVSAGNVNSAGLWSWIGAVLACRSGDLERAEAGLRRSLSFGADRAYHPRIFVGSLLGEVLALAGRQEEAAAAVSAASALESDGDRRGLAGLLDLGAAMAATSDGDAEVLFGRAVATLERVGCAFEAARAFEHWGWRTGRTEPLDRALAIYDRAGAADSWKERALTLRAR